MSALIFALTAIILLAVGARLEGRRKLLSMQTHERAKQVHALREGYNKACRMSLFVTHQTKPVMWGYMARIEHQAARLNLADLYPIDPVMQSCIRTLAGPRLVED